MAKATEQIEQSFRQSDLRDLVKAGAEPRLIACGPRKKVKAWFLVLTMPDGSQRYLANEGTGGAQCLFDFGKAARMLEEARTREIHVPLLAQVPDQEGLFSLIFPNDRATSQPVI